MKHKNNFYKNMKHIKSINEYFYFTENFPVRNFTKITEPEKPFKRRLTKEESDFMRNNFSIYSYTSNIDKNGYIILSGGEDGGLNYITEDDLKKYMNE